MKPRQAARRCSSPALRRGYRPENSFRPENSIRGPPALPVYDKNGKEAGIWLSSLTDDGRLQVMGARDG
jgi:hypothetical protein